MIKITFDLRPGWQPPLIKSTEDGGISEFSPRQGLFRVNLTPAERVELGLAGDAQILIEVSRYV